MKLVGDRILVIDLKEEAEEIIAYIKKDYKGIIDDFVDGEKQISMDFIQETKVYDVYAHAYTEYLYVYIKEHLKELIEDG
jgi:hypothetical protein